MNDASEADLAVLEKLEKDQQVLSPGERRYSVVFINDVSPIADDVRSSSKFDRLLSGSVQI